MRRVGDDLLGRDGEQALVGLHAMTEAGRARWIAQHDAWRAVGTIAFGIGRSKQRDNRNVQGCGEVHGASVSANEQAGAAHERDEFPNGERQGLGSSRTGCLGHSRERLFARAEVDDGPQTLTGESLRNVAIAFGRPLLRAPAGTRIQDRGVANVQGAKALFHGFFGDRIAGKNCVGNGKRSPDGGSRDISILVDHVCVLADDPARVPHAGDVFARLRCTIDRGRTGPARENCRTCRALKIHGKVIMMGAQIAQARSNALPGMVGKDGASPRFEADSVNHVDQRPLRRGRAGARSGERAEQFGPTFFDQPSQRGMGKSFAQHGCRGQGVNDVAHRTQAYDEDPLEFRSRGVGSHRAHGFRGMSRLRMISLAE